MSCGEKEINWYQQTEADRTPQPIDITVFTDNKTSDELQVFTKEASKAIVYTMLYEVYLKDYPVVKTSIKKLAFT